MLHFEVSPEELIPINGLITYQDLENILITNKEDIHDTNGHIDESKVISIAMLKYKCTPYRLSGIGTNNGKLIFIRE